ncbi:MAG: sugar ABC transporter ATP-binding protein [Desulfobacterales bacterium]|nr:MAG: sugar ABC transporter ATP-binding protein [Desulfobacterales bacterium]
MASFLEVKNISKAFDGVQALEDVSMAINAGAIHCLVGENGSGKSTLIKIIGGVLKPDKGEIRIDGKLFRPGRAIDSIRRGIQIIYQDLSLFPNLTAAENISLNQLIEKGNKFISEKNVIKTSEKALMEIEEECDLFAKVENLSMSKRQIVAISRALTQNARLIIMDEPTSAITKAEIDHLFSVIMRLQAKGIATLFVSHKLGEVFEIAENVTILRDGRKIGDYAAGELDNDKLTFLMTGQKIVSTPYVRDPENLADANLLEVKNLSRKGHYRNITFAIKRGDILGITGLIGSGRTELALSLFGLNRPDSGEIVLEGRSVEINSAEEAIKLGVGYLPEDRLLQGLFVEKSIGSNIVVTIVAKLLNRLKLISGAKRQRVEYDWIDKLKIKTPSAALPASSLSGGNQQRVVLAKWLATNLKLFVLDGPTIGIDIASKSNIHDIIRDFAGEGVGIILISDEIPEVLQHCNRALVMREGRIAAAIEDITRVSESDIFDMATAQNVDQVR